MATEQHNPSLPKVLPGIQLLRGLSALLVVGSHANLILGKPEYLGDSPYPTILHEAGLFGVSIFFIISGFIIALVSLNGDLSPRLSRTEFARRRFIRIVPFLWVCVIGYNLLSYVGAGTVEWGPALRAFFVWPVGELKPNVVWSLRHEFIFYALFALLMMGPRRHIAILIAWFAAPLIFWPIFYATGWQVQAAPLGGWEELLSVVLLGALGGANFQFGVGFLFGCLTIRGHALMGTRSANLLWPLVVTIAVALAADWIALPAGLSRSVVWTLLAAIPAWLGIVTNPDRGRLRKLGMKLGDSSFALYLVHNPVLLIAFDIGRHFHLLGNPLFLPAAVVCAAIAGLTAHRFVEKPLIAALSHGRALAPWQRLRPRSDRR